MSVPPEKITAVILAGGFGTRIKHLLGDLPKPMALVNGQPFVEWVVRYLAAAEKYSRDDIINISSGHVLTIKELTETVAELTGYPGKVVWDITKPDGQIFKGLDVTRMKEWLGGECRTSLRAGLQETIAWFESKPLGLRL